MNRHALNRTFTGRGAGRRDWLRPVRNPLARTAAVALLGLLGMLAGERGALLALRHFGSQLYEVPPAQTLAHPSDDRMRKTPEE